MSYDLIVVGGGLAGLNAAWECQKAGLSVLILEARDRPGGRTYTVTHDYQGKESHFDLGAHFIGDDGYQTSIWNLVKKLGLETFPQWDGPDKPPFVPGGDTPYWAGQGANLQELEGETAAYIGTTIPPSSAGQAYMVYLEELSEGIPLTAPHLATNAEHYDALSVWDWVSQIDLPGYGPAPDTFKALTRMLCRVGFSAEPEHISMLWLLFYVASSGGLARFQALRWPIQGAQGYRLVKGAQSISLAIVERMQATDANCLKLNQIVSSVSDDGNSVTVKCTSGESYQGSRALIAMAPILCSEIAFQPPLPEARVKAAENMSNSSMIMTYVTFDSTFWRDNKTKYPQGSVNGMPTDNISRYGLSGDVLATDGPVVWIMDNTSAEGQPALFAFLVGEEARKLADKPKADRERAVLDVMSKFFGPEVMSNNPTYFEMDWNAELYSQGCPASHFLPGSFFKYGTSVLLSGLGPRPHGNVFFASTESATVSNGYMDGAVWSGQQVSYHILQSLGANNVPRVTAPQARASEMEWCVKTILNAIEKQIPQLEFPALAEDVVFLGPGGSSLPNGPYVGKDGTFAFYLSLAEHFTITAINVETVSIDVENNTAYATWTASGSVNSNGNPFHDVPGTMLFEFTDPSETDVLIQRDWLFMDSMLIDNMFAAAPGEFSPKYQPDSYSGGNKGVVNDSAIAAFASAWIDDFQKKLSSLDENVAVFGPGGKAIPMGPYVGASQHADFVERVAAVKIVVEKISSKYLDKTNLTYYGSLTISGESVSQHTPFKQRLVIALRFKNDPGTPTIEKIRFSTDGLALD